MVDIDVDKFFDRVNHDMLMSRLSKRINDKRLLKIIRRFLEVGMMKQGGCIERLDGLSQGSLCKALHKDPYAKESNYAKKIIN